MGFVPGQRDSGTKDPLSDRQKRRSQKSQKLTKFFYFFSKIVIFLLVLSFFPVVVPGQNRTAYQNPGPSCYKMSKSCLGPFRGKVFSFSCPLVLGQWRGHVLLSLCPGKSFFQWATFIFNCRCFTVPNNWTAPQCTKYFMSERLLLCHCFNATIFHSFRANGH